MLIREFLTPLLILKFLGDPSDPCQGRHSFGAIVDNGILRYVDGLLVSTVNPGRPNRNQFSISRTFQILKEKGPRLTGPFNRVHGRTFLSSF